MPKDEERIKPVIEEVTPEAETSGLDIPQEAYHQTHIDPEVPIKGLEDLDVPPKKSSFKLIFLTALVTAVVVALLAGGIYVYLTGTNRIPKVETPQPSPTPTIVPSPSPTIAPETEEEIDLTSFSLSILNGSGKIGEAGRARGLLEKAGFEVENVGNASRFDFKETLIQVKDEVPQTVVESLKKALAETYEVEVGEILEVDSAYDIVITVGSL